MNAKLCCAALAALLAQASAAVTLPADGTLVALPGTDAATQTSLHGLVVEDVSTPFSYTLESNGAGASFLTYTLSGTVRSRVVRSVDGSYDFYWRITPDWRVPFSGSDPDGNPVRGVDGPPYHAPLGISSFTLSSFNASSYRADWRTDGPGNVAPIGAAGGRGRVVFGFGDDFVNPVTGGWENVPALSMFPHEESTFVFLDTDAQAYRRSGAFALHSLADGLFAGDSGTYQTFAPVPEPATWALMLLGLGVTAGFAKRRSRG